MTAATTENADVAALNRINACSPAVAYVAERGSLTAAWASCERGDWMLWLLGKLTRRNVADPFGTEPHRKLVGCLTEIVTTLALPFAGDKRVADCAAVRRRYAEGEAVTRDEILEARRNAYAAAADAYAAARAKSLKASAEIVRTWYPQAPSLNGSRA